LAKDLRTWLKELEKNVPGELVRVSKELDPAAFETTAILDQMESQGRFEGVLFEKVKDLKGRVSPFNILMNTFGTLRKIGVALDLPEGNRIEIIERMLDRQTKAMKPLKISKGEAPVKEVKR
jgi:UbiD family decarboxylase